MRVTATGPLQTIVDSLAADIRRDVAIDDRQIRWIVHSPHFDEPDAARLQSILERRSSDDAAQWAFSFGIEQAEGPVRLPANERIGAQPRLCIPLRSHGVLLGFLFIVDADESLSEQEVEQAQAAAGAAAAVLYRERRLRELERGRERWLLMHLLDDEAEGDEAARALVDEGFLDAQRVALLVARAEPGAQEREQVELAIGAALDRLRRDVPARGGVALRQARPRCLPRRARRPGDDLAACARRAAARRSPTTRASRRRRASVSARRTTSPRRASPTARRATRSRSPSASSASAGSRSGTSSAPTARLPGSRSTPRDTALHPGLLAMLSDPANAPLVDTLEVYLDLAGDAKAAAEALTLHRATLYYRLNRIEEITGARLKTGDDRLALHLGLRLARLSGLR